MGDVIAVSIVVVLLIAGAIVWTWCWWRLYRSNEHERKKAAMDQVMYGQGFMTVDHKGRAQHIPYRDIYNEPASTPNTRCE